MLKKTVTARETVSNSAQLKKVWQNELILLYIPSFKSEKPGIQRSGSFIRNSVVCRNEEHYSNKVQSYEKYLFELPTFEAGWLLF